LGIFAFVFVRTVSQQTIAALFM